jgi:hypothetical protein
LSPASRQLEHRVAGVRGHLTRRAAIGAALWVAGGVGLLFLVAWISAGADGWRPGSNVPMALDLIAALLLVVGAAAFRRAASRSFAEVPLTKSMEAAAGIRPGTLRGSLELSRAVPHGVSGTLATRAVLHAARDLDGRGETELSGELGRRVAVFVRRGMGFVVVLAVLLAGLAVLQPERTSRVLAGVASPIATATDPERPPIVVSPGDIEVMRGTDVQVAVQAEGRPSIVLSWQAAGDVAYEETLAVVEGVAAHVFQSVGATIEYRVRDENGRETDTYRIVPVDPLFVSDLLLSVVYPAYTGIPADEYRGERSSSLTRPGRELLDSVSRTPLSTRRGGQPATVSSSGSSRIGPVRPPRSSRSRS